VKPLFWFSVSLIFFAYAGYPIWLCFRARFRPRFLKRENILPSVTAILAVHNEQRYLPDKLRNLAAVDYPADRLQVIVVSDGSTDETNTILAASEGIAWRNVILPERRGKANALNHGITEAQGEIIVFTDARQALAVDALKNLVANFADPSVGCVSGELIIGEDSSTSSSQGVGLYWQLEKKIRHWEGLVGSTIGATGALYAVRRTLVSHIPQGTILDDVYIPLDIVRQGYRVIFEPRALAWDPFIPGPKQEFRRKLRTLVGNYQLLQLAPWLLTNSCPVRFQFVCHKLLRLLVPFALVGALGSTLWLRETPFYETVLALQLIFYGLGALKLAHAKFSVLARVADVSLAFIVLNTAAVVALIYFVTDRKATWVRT
jgi:poly-beta-1,6-N-acetyl-D-glucosamine synthase